MSDQDKTGGAAFPRRAGKLNTEPQQVGMTLRDYFAAKALVLFADADTLRTTREDAKHQGAKTPVMIADAVYQIADAMLNAREAK